MNHWPEPAKVVVVDHPFFDLLTAEACTFSMSWQQGPLPSQTKRARDWRTRVDPFADIWDRDIEPLLAADARGVLDATTLMAMLEERKRRLDEIFTLLPEVGAFRNRPGGVLSGGQGKMVALGRALMIGTRYVLLDEPFQGLAPALALSYAETLVRLRKSRPELGLLITESTPKLLDKIVDTSLLIERGEISPSQRQAA